jgi:hypothetical protein
MEASFTNFLISPSEMFIRSTISIRAYFYTEVSRILDEKPAAKKKAAASFGVILTSQYV